VLIIFRILATVKPTITTATSQTIQKKAEEPYENMGDWFRSQKDMPDSEDQENLYASINSSKMIANDYEDIESATRHRNEFKTQTLQTHIYTSEPHAEYLTILTDAERADCTSGMTRSHSDSHLQYSSENSYTEMSEAPIDCNSHQLTVHKHAHTLEHQVDTIDTFSSQDTSLPNTFASTDEDLYTEPLQADTILKNKPRNSNHKIKKRVCRPPAASVSIPVISSQNQSKLSHSYEDISDIINGSAVGPKQILGQTTSSLDIPSYSANSMPRVKSHSSGQLNSLSALDKEVYHFISNSLHPKRRENSQPSLNEIFERYCQNEKASSLLSSECSSLCSSVECFSDNSGTASPTVEQNVRSLNGNS